MTPTVDALARDWRVLTDSLDAADVFRSLDRATDTPELRDQRFVLVGVSFGGLLAVDFSARHPERVAALLIVSAPAPDSGLDGRVAAYLKHPRWSVPGYLARGAGRMWHEALRSRPFPSSLWLLAELAGRAIRWPIVPRHAAGWIHQWSQYDLTTGCRRITAPTLVVTGEPDLDQVVPTTSTLEYLRLIPGARSTCLAGTGHIGVVSRPAAFARIVRDFAAPYAH